MDAGYLLQEGLALKEEARGLGRYLIEDFAQYGAHRKREGRQTLLIIDEYSAIAHGDADAANLFERVCSFDAAVIVSSQSYAGLGTDAERILDAVGSVVLHACADPEHLSRRAGIEPDRTKTISGRAYDE